MPLASRASPRPRRVLERYPTNGKLLRCYGKFLEEVQHDGVAAARAYAEAARNGGADAIMSLDLSAVQQAANKPEFLTSLSLVDDAVVVINATGSIMMVSQVRRRCCTTCVVRCVPVCGVCLWGRLRCHRSSILPVWWKGPCEFGGAHIAESAAAFASATERHLRRKPSTVPRLAALFLQAPHAPDPSEPAFPQFVQSIFGYTKAELEGSNVSLLMPQPFSQRHDGYLARYVGGGEPHILDTVREVVALHKVPRRGEGGAEESGA